MADPSADHFEKSEDRWNEEAAAFSDRTGSLSGLTHSRVQGENGRGGIYH
jgi:hypothetical protein